MIKSKKQMFMVIGVFTLVMLLGEITYAFFNYTRTGAANRISVGDIYFTSSYDEIALDGVFPIDKNNINADTDNVMSVDVDIEGHTTYANGLYYEVKASDVNLTVNGKNIPIGISVTSNNLDNVTLTNYEDGKVLTNGSLFANGRILASTGTTDNSVDGTITIKAYLDKDRIAISDTYNGVETDLMGTTTGWVGGRVVLTTSEWNSLASTPISFKIKVEAYENDVSTLVSGAEFNRKLKKLSGSITPEIEEQYNEQISQFESALETASPEQIEQIFSMYGVSSLEEFILLSYSTVVDNSITSIARSYEEPDISLFTEDNIISTDDSIYPIYAWYESGIIKYYSKTNNIKANNNMATMFSIMKSLTSIGDLSSLDMTNVSNMMGLFSNDLSLNDISFLSNWNTSNVTNMTSMFRDCTGLTTINGLSNWNVSNVITMRFMLESTAITDLTPLTNWNVSNVTNMSNMFYECTELTTLSGLSTWNVSKVTNMSEMFSKCTGLESLRELFNWNVSSVTDMSNMFQNCTGLTSLDGLSTWNVSNVTDMSFMFWGCNGLIDIGSLSNWDVSNVIDMQYLFAVCSSITNLNSLSNWDTSSVTNMYTMFGGDTSLSDASGINDWNINNVTNFNSMFYQSSVHPTFTKRAGTWNGSGTFTPSA